MGYGVPYPEAALPRSVPKLVYGLVHEAGVKKERLEWHGHNDFHKVLVNAEAAWLYGCAAANGTLLGFGERCGNPPLEGLIIEYIGLTGHTNGIDTTVITEIAEYLQRETGFQIPVNYPFVGKNFNLTMAGIHADGVIKDPEIYSIFDTDKILNRPLGVNVTDKSGVAGIAFWLDHYFHLSGDKKIDKRHPAVLKISDWVDQQYAALRTTAISDEEMLEQVKQHLPELITK
jgi:isopropylmalate/homocitrate/citramalate synthase